MNGPASEGPWAVELHGYGRVGRAFVDRWSAHGFAHRGLWGRTGLAVPGSARGRPVFVDATSPCYAGSGAEAWIRRLEGVLEAGTPVVTCNKAPLALDWSRLCAAARRGGTSLSCSATVGGGTPVLLALRRLQRTQGIVRVDAALSGTLSYVLDRVAEGTSVRAATAEAVRAGVAEPDPRLDLDGSDSIAKAVIVHNLLFPPAPPLSLREIPPDLRLEEERIRALAASGGPVRAVVAITPGRVELELARFPEAGLSAGGAAPAVVRATLEGGETAILIGPGAGPHVTAGALVGDLLALSEALPGEVGGIRP